MCLGYNVCNYVSCMAMFSRYHVWGLLRFTRTYLTLIRAVRVLSYSLQWGRLRDRPLHTEGVRTTEAAAAGPLGERGNALAGLIHWGARFHIAPRVTERGKQDPGYFWVTKPGAIMGGSIFAMGLPAIKGYRHWWRLLTVILRQPQMVGVRLLTPDNQNGVAFFRGCMVGP